MIGFTYTQLVQAMQDWPVNVGANYVGNIPRFVELGELRLVRDLNLDIFDSTDSSFVLNTGTTVITKPVSCIALRTMRLAPITYTNAIAANPTALGISQPTTNVNTTLVFNGTLGGAPCTVPTPAQVTVTDTSGIAGGVIVTVTGLDAAGNPQYEQIFTVNNGVAEGIIRWSVVQTLTSQNGSGAQTISIGTAATSQSTFGKAFPIFKRSYDFVSNYGSDPSVTLPPRYYAESTETSWIVAQAADQNYGVLLRFIQRPQTIVTAGTTWLGNWCGELLLLCSLMEAENYLKADDRFADLSGDYATKLQVARVEMRNIIRQGDYSPVKPAAAPVQG